jgi:hypothetical protein
MGSRWVSWCATAPKNQQQTSTIPCFSDPQKPACFLPVAKLNDSYFSLVVLAKDPKLFRKMALRIRNFGVLGITLVLAVGVRSRTVLADEGGVGFWLPGQFGSLAAVHSAPGWAFPVIYTHPSATAGAGTSFRRGAEITAGLVTRSDLVQITPTYTFSSSVAGGQAAVSLAVSLDLQKLE